MIEIQHQLIIYRLCRPLRARTASESLLSQWPLRPLAPSHGGRSLLLFRPASQLPRQFPLPLLSAVLCCALLFASATHPCHTQPAPYFSRNSISTWPLPDHRPEPPIPYSNDSITKRPVSNKIGSRHSQVHQAPLFQLGSCVGNTMLALQVCQIPLKLSAASHQLSGLLQGWSTCRDNFFLLFYSCFVRISTNLVATMPSCTIFFSKRGSY